MLQPNARPPVPASLWVQPGEDDGLPGAFAFRVCLGEAIVQKKKNQKKICSPPWSRVSKGRREWEREESGLSETK